MTVSGVGLPDVLQVGLRKAKTVIREVGYDLDAVEVYVNVHGSIEATYDADEYLKELGEGWTLDPEPLQGPEELSQGG
jgi:hypothetical protein